jgi:hypothetical protein
MNSDQICRMDNALLFQDWDCAWISERPNTVATFSKAWIVFDLSNTGVMGSSPTRGMDVYVYSATGWSLVQGDLLNDLD